MKDISQVASCCSSLIFTSPVDVVIEIDDQITPVAARQVRLSHQVIKPAVAAKVRIAPLQDMGLRPLSAR